MAMVKEPLLFARLPLGARRLLFGLVLFAICFLFAFPVLWLILTSLRPVIVVCVVIRAIDAFRTFDIVWTLTGGGPGRSTELFSLYAYVLAFLTLDFGRGSAAAIIGGIIILVVGVVLYRVVDRIARA